MPARAVFTGPSGYRNAEDGLRARRDQLLAERSFEATTVPEALLDLYARRVARITAGWVGLAGAAALAAAILVQARGLTAILLTALTLMLPGYLIGYAEGRLRARRLLAAFVRPSDNMCADIARWERTAPSDALILRADRLERSSVALPLAALAFLAPLSLHYLFAVLFVDQRADQFENWITLSAMVVGHSHVVLALAAFAYARRLRRAPTSGLPSGGMAALGWTSASSLATAMFWPPLLIAAGIVVVTGLAFIPLMFGWIRHRVATERALLELPRAQE